MFSHGASLNNPSAFWAQFSSLWFIRGDMRPMRVLSMTFAIKENRAYGLNVFVLTDRVDCYICNIDFGHYLILKQDQVLIWIP